MVRQTTKVIILEIFGVISLLLIAAVLLLAAMLASGPVDIGIFREDVEKSLSSVRAGREVSVDHLTLEWSPSQRRLFVVAQDITFMDTGGEAAGFADRAELTLDAGSVFLGELEVLDASLHGGWLNLRNIEPNRWEIAGDPLPALPTGTMPQTPRALLDRGNAVLKDLLTGLEAMNGTLELEALSFDDMQLRYFDQAGQEVLRIDNFVGELNRAGEDTSLRVSGEGASLGLPGRFEVALSTTQNYDVLRSDLTVEQWPISDLAERFDLTGFISGGLTANITIGSGVTRLDGIQRVDINIERQAGTLDLPYGGERLNDLYLDLSYLIGADAVEINTLLLETDRLGGTFTGRLDNVLSENTLRRLSLQAQDVRVDMSDIFPSAWRFEDLDVVADLADDFSIIAFESAKTTIDGVDFQASGELDWRVDFEEGQLPISLDATAEAIGELKKETILKFWPEGLGSGARRYVNNRLLDGTVTEVAASIALRPDSMAEGYLRDSDLLVEFSFVDGAVQFLSDMPVATGAVGTGKLTGNSFALVTAPGEYQGWSVEEVQVAFPKFNPKGEDFTLRVTGEGPIVTVLQLLADSRLDLDEKSGLDPQRVSGNARAELFFSQPALDNVMFSDMTLKVTGSILEAGLENAFAGLALSDGTVQVDLTNERLILTGYGEIGQAPVQFTWRDALREDNAPADLSASAIVTPDVLNTFGLIGRAYLTGEIPVEMQGQVGKEGLGKASFSFDLRESRIDVAELGWIKPAGELAKATLTYSGDLEQQASALRIESVDGQLDGDILLNSAGRLEALTLRKLFIEGRADVAGTVTRPSGGGIELALNGAFLDVSSFLGDLSAVGGAGDGFDLNLKFDAAVDRLRLRRGLELSGANLAVVSTSDGLQRVRANGETQGGAALAAGFDQSETGQPAIFLRTEDAGFLAEAFLDLDYIEGGVLDLEGTLGGNGQPMRLMAKVADGRLINAPFITQILSLASLRGLSDTLSGEGVLFSDIEVPMTVGGGRYIIDGGRASGPALGLTMNGWIGTDGEGIELNGVLVPSFGVNSMLGGVPVIGDLFVGREGEGIFSITYSVNGTLEKAQVAVNPLSAVTPGILRRIFENPSDTSLPSALPVDPNLKPPTAKLPELPEDEFIPSAPGE